MTWRDRPAVPTPLDPFIPAPDIRERFETVALAPPDVVMEAARTYDMQSHPLVAGVFRLRGLLLRSTPTTRVPAGLVDEMRGLGWGILRDDPGVLVAGATCQPWLADVRFHPLPPDEFLAYGDAGQVKIAWTLETTRTGEATVLASETRAVATDPEARARFRRYWRWARVGIVGIRLLLLPDVARRAEAAWRETPR